MKEHKVVGRNIPRVDALEKVTGRAKFGADFNEGGLLHAKVLRSPYPHAKIHEIDTSKAENLPGVRAVLTPKDVPPIPLSALLADQYVLCKDNVVRCVGEPVAAVAADTIEIAEEAVDLIEVDYEELPAVFDFEDAFKKDPEVIVHPDLSKYKKGSMPIRLDPARPNVCQTHKIRCGDIEKGLQEADILVENRFTTTRVQHCQLEPTMAEAWFESDGTLTVRSPNTNPFGRVSFFSALFNLPPSKVRILTPYTGGSFGGKGGRGRAEPIAALLAKVAGRPVRLTYTREEMFVVGGHRVPFRIDIKDGIKRNGTLVAREITAVLGLGAHSDLGLLLVKRAPSGAVGTYRIPHFKLDTYGVYTNTPMACAYRGFGCPEIEWAIEQQMDIIAAKLSINPVEIRKKNILNNGDRDVSGMITRSIGVRECLDKVVERLGRPEKENKKEKDGEWKRGTGIAIGNKSIMSGHPSVVIVKVCRDGIVEVRHSATEVGQGIKTTLAQIAAEEFGITVERIRVVSGDTAFCPYDDGTVASRALVHNGNALIEACQDAKQQLFKMVAKKIEAAPGDLITNNGKIFVKGSPASSINITDLFDRTGVPHEGGEILGKGAYSCTMIPEDPETGQTERGVYAYSHTANAVEVAVNVETGEVKILQSYIACDVGKAINPMIVEGQIDGGMGMSIGPTLYEEIVMDRGKVKNSSFLDYHLPTTLDMPKCENSKAIIVETAEQEGPFGAKGVGELPVVATAPAIAMAVYDATGIRIKDLPLSEERVLEEIKRQKNL